MADAAIAAEGLGKRFGRVHALDGVDLELPAGAVLGVLGPNGAGKTTLVRILATLLKPDRGRARVAGFDVAEHPAAVRRRIGLSGQYAAVDPFLTGQENLVMIGRLLRAAPPPGAPPGRGADRPARAGRRGRAAGAHLLRGDAAPARCRRQPARRAPGPVPGRADHRAGPVRAASLVAGASRPDRPGHQPAADHPVHRGSRTARQADRHHRPRHGHRQRHARPAQSSGRGRPAGGAVPARPGPAAAGRGAVRARHRRTGRRCGSGPGRPARRRRAGDPSPGGGPAGRRWPAGQRAGPAQAHAGGGLPGPHRRPSGRTRPAPHDVGGPPADPAQPAHRTRGAP